MSITSSHSIRKPEQEEQKQALSFSSILKITSTAHVSYFSFVPFCPSPSATFGFLLHKSLIWSELEKESVETLFTKSCAGGRLYTGAAAVIHGGIISVTTTLKSAFLNSFDCKPNFALLQKCLLGACLGLPQPSSTFKGFIIMHKSRLPPNTKGAEQSRPRSSALPEKWMVIQHWELGLLTTWMMMTSLCCNL